VKYRNEVGTGFTIEFSGKQYLITAKHILNGANSRSAVIEIFRDNKWQELRVTPWFCDKIDIVVFPLNEFITPNHELPAFVKQITVSQDVYFLGFPYGMRFDSGKLNNNYPFPFVKKGIVSGLDFSTSVKVIFIDGHNNKGFSGGPVVFFNQAKKLCVCGIISAYINDQKGNKNLTEMISENSGIFVAYSIGHAIDKIKEFVEN